MTWLSTRADIECCYVTTTGRRTGRPHEIEIWFGVIDEVMYLISGTGATADWYLNALAAPEVSVRLGSHTRLGVSRQVIDPDERARVGDVMGAKYDWDGDPSIGLSRHDWCYSVPVLAITGWTMPRR